MKFFGLLICIVLLSCEAKRETAIPDNLILKKDLISIIIELETVEAYFEQVHKRPLLYKDALDSSCLVVLQKYGVTKPQLESSIDYYSFYPDSIFSIYEATLDTVNNMVNSAK